MTSDPRVIVWFSCGAASAVALHRALELYDYSNVQVQAVYCDTAASEHPDNERFLADVERWLGIKVVRITGEYADVDDVFMRTRYMAGINGARCTVEMKKRPRFSYQRPTDIHIFGYTADEGKRMDRFRANHPAVSLDFILAEEGLNKQDCFKILGDAGVSVPVMYKLGFRNNNCLGCVKATSARYWNMTREMFPEVFQRRAEQSRELGVRLTRFKGKRIFLDELPIGYMWGEVEDLSCGPDCR